MTDKEKRDAYIAAAVGGVALVLIYLYIHSAPLIAGGAGTLPDATQTAGLDQNPYNYNIQPYGGDGPLNIPARGPISTNYNNLGGGSGGCCDACGTKTGSSYQNPGVLAYLKLLALGG